MRAPHGFAAAVGAALLATSGYVFADEVKPGEITLDRVPIVVRRPLPAAAIMVARVPIDVTLQALRKPLVDRIGAAAERDPF